MKIKFILFPCLVGLLALASCSSQTKDTKTSGTKEDVLTTTSLETTTREKNTTSTETTKKEETTTGVVTTTSGVSNDGTFDDGEDWGELHT